MGETRLAWRNVWRSPRRTALTVAATVFAVFLVVVFVAMTRGVHEKMIEDSVRLSSGHVLVTAPGYLQKRTLDEFLVLDDAAVHTLDTLPEVVGWAPRVVSFVLLSRDVTSRGVAVMGVDPARESTVTTLSTRVVDGHFIRGGSPHEIVIGERLAERLGASVGDQLLLYGVAYTLETAYDLYTVVGLLRLPDARLERSMAIVSLADLQEFLVFGDRISEIAVLAESSERTGALRDALRRGLAMLDSRPVFHTWREVMPDLEQLIVLDDLGFYVMVAILITVVGFGILNTILMAVLERQRELGVMLAVGLRPAAVFRIVFLESLMLAAVGLVFGLVLAVPTALWFEAHPIHVGGTMAATFEFVGMEPVIVFRLTSSTLWKSSLLILAVAAVAALYPALKASRANPVDALRTI